MKSINSSATLEIIPNDGSYDPPPDLLDAAKELPGQIVVALSFDKYEPLLDTMKTLGIESEMPFQDAMALYKKSSPNLTWKKIRWDKTRVSLFNVSNKSIPDSTRKKDVFLGHENSDVLEMKFRVVLASGRETTVSMYLFKSGQEAPKLSTSFSFSSFSTYSQQ